MSAAAPLPGTGKGETISILGRKVSWDAILIAGAGVLGVIFLYKAGQPGTAIGSSTATPADSSGTSLTSLTDPLLNPLTPSDPTKASSSPVRLSANPVASFVNSIATPQSSSPLAAAAAHPTTAAPLNNYSPAYAASAGPKPASVSGSGLRIANAFSGVPIIGRVISQIAATPVQQYPGLSFNPVVPRSSGTQAV